MRFVIVEKDDDQSRAGKEKIVAAFTAAGFLYDEEKPELVISIGGDGTLLDAFRLYDKQLADVKFVGIHSGHLGFYTDWRLAEIDAFITSVIEKEATYEAYPLLKAEVHCVDGTQTFLALNELTVADYRRTLSLDVYIDEQHFETFKGTGLCISTPSGSTGYNKALGGAIVHPSMKTFQLAEIASINNTVFRTVGSSIVLGQSENIRLEPCEEHADIVFTADRVSTEFTSDNIVHGFNIAIAEEQIVFARYRAVDFWQRVHRSFIDNDGMK